VARDLKSGLGMRLTMTLLTLPFLLAACGGADPQPRTAGDGEAEAAENPNPMPVAETGADWVPRAPRLDNPSLTVRVDGPTPVEEPSQSMAVETRVTITNEGDEAAEVDTAYVAMDAWAADGARTPCAQQGDPGEPPLLEPGEAHQLRVVALCSLGAPGTYELRTYVAFTADAIDGSLEVERYYAGRHEIQVR